MSNSTGTNCGLLRNAQPLNNQQIQELEAKVIAEGGTVLCIDSDGKLCLLGKIQPTDDLKDIAWHKFHQLATTNNTETMTLFKNSANAQGYELVGSNLERNSSNGLWQSSNCNLNIGFILNADGTYKVRSIDASQNNVEINIPSVYNSRSITSISDMGFQECPNLKIITIPNSVTSIGSYAFQKCPSLSNITIPDSVISVGHDLFRECTSLTEATISNNITCLEAGTFFNCNKLKNFTIPEGVTSIANYVFRKCSSLSTIRIPYGVTSIGQNAFCECSNLTSAIIPSTVTTMYGSTFSSCTNLKDIYVGFSSSSAGAKNAPWGASKATVHYNSV